MHQTNHLNLRQKDGLKQIMTYVERIAPIVIIKFKTSVLTSSLCDFSDA